MFTVKTYAETSEHFLFNFMKVLKPKELSNYFRKKLYPPAKSIYVDPVSTSILFWNI